MQQSPELERLEQILKSHKFSGPGFLGEDQRSLAEILEADAAVLFELGTNCREVAARMEEITGTARAGLETTVRISPELEVRIIESRGMIPCPWPHPGRYGKAVTTAKRRDTGKTISWSDLNIHLIEKHGFFEGRGAFFRLDPRELVEIIFPAPD